jgi:hypothetical protein
MSDMPTPRVSARVCFLDARGRHRPSIVTAVRVRAGFELIELRMQDAPVTGWSIPYAAAPRPFSWHWPASVSNCPTQPDQRRDLAA